MYIAENNGEFVYIRDLQYNHRFYNWHARTTWATYTTSFTGIDGHRVWAREFYPRGNA